MLAFLFKVFFLTAEAAAAAGSEGVWSKFVHFWEQYANFPGFEAWKFLNLAVFIAIMYYLLKTPLSGAFKARREAVRAELIEAEKQKKAAAARLAAAEQKMAGLQAERSAIIARARAEAEAEKERIASQTVSAIAKMREQAESEIERRRKQVRLELRRFAAEESIRLAEADIRKSLNAAKDAELVRAGIKSIGGLV